MKIKAHEVYKQLQQIGYDISSLLRQAQDHDDIIYNIEFEDSADGRMYRNEIYKMLDHLEAFKRDIDYLRCSVSSEGYLQKNSSGRYELNGNDLTCGSGVEILITDEDNKEEWRITRIEHDGDDYYAVGCKGISLDGLKARRRKR